VSHRRTRPYNGPSMPTNDSGAERNGGRESLRTYLDSLSSRHVPAAGGNLPRRVARTLISPSRRSAVAVALTEAKRPLERRRAATAAREGNLRLHLGSAWQPKEGWFNVDLAGHPVDLAWNLAHGLPFPDGSAAAIFHEHLLEHLPLEAAAKLIEESYRVLRPGGVMRIAVPDAGRYLLSYASGGEGLIDEYRPGRPTNLLAAQEIFYLHGHRSAWDLETLELFVRAAGFEQCDGRAFGDSRIEPCPDSPHREEESIYLEAVKAE
jgi:predicted SAM-dependent methyltransferase